MARSISEKRTGAARSRWGFVAAAAMAAAGIAGCMVGAPTETGGNQPTPTDDPGPVPTPATEATPLSLGATVTQAVPPPPISGGTLAAYGSSVVASDPDRDQIYLVDTSTMPTRPVVTLALGAGDEPGRAVFDKAGRAHVALRRGGAIVDIDFARGTILGRRPVCAAPRGIAYDAAKDQLHVACAGGELVTFAAAGGAAVASVQLDDDLRDVVVQGDDRIVSRFRSAQLLHVDSNGNVVGRTSVSDTLFGAEIAWRMIANPQGGVRMVHQVATSTTVTPTPGGYGGGGPCAPAVVSSQVSDLDVGLANEPGLFNGSALLPDMVLAVDVAMSPSGGRTAIVAAGTAHNPGAPTVLEVVDMPSSSCGVVDPGMPAGQPTAAAYLSEDSVAIQMREPAQLVIHSAADGYRTIALSSVSREDTGHTIFHANAGAGLACASCHAEGGDDARTWDFTTSGLRRTPSLRGTLQGTAPYHWGGDMKDVPMLAREVFSSRMSGPKLADDQSSALQSWLFQIPAPPAAPVDDAARRGKALFENAQIGCTSCHNGAMLTNNATVDVGTGGAFQVPSLVGVRWRAPYLHDGCAATLESRFDRDCGGAAHGNTASLTGSDIADLVAYLKTL